jgi:hypothetical protein
MKTALNHAPPTAAGGGLSTIGPGELLSEALRRHRALTLFGLLMWVAMLPTLVAWGLDERTLRGVSVWAKPLKFMASIGLFSLCTAWFIGLLAPAQRHSRTVQLMAWTLLIAGALEITYITLQAALGQASHFNFSSPLHMTMYSLMGLGALAMTSTQAVLAWQVARHPAHGLHPVWRDAVVAGLALTFVLGAGAGGVLGSMQPPAGTGLPVVGWHLAGDLRPAHFLGMHAQQIMPIAGALIAWRLPRHGRAVLVGFTLVYVALWAWAMARGLDGAVLTVPYVATR